MYVYLFPTDKFAVTTRNNVYSRDFIRESLTPACITFAGR